MATPSQYLEKAASYIGISGTDNIFNTWYWGYHCYDPDTYPWCAAYQSYVACHDLGMALSPSASAAGLALQCPRVADEDVQPGDFVLFNWDGRQDFSWADHIGVVEWVDINGSGYFGTIEGNTNTWEGEVARCTRYNWTYYGTAFFRPPYDGSPSPTPGPTPPAGDVVRYCVSCDPAGQWWFSEMQNDYDTGGSGDTYAGDMGMTIKWIACNAKRYRVFSRASGWLPWVDQYNPSDLEYGCAGDGSDILALEVDDDNVKYAIAISPDWHYDWLIGRYDTGGSGDTYAGDMENAAIALWMTRA